jgi:hypothetical protein
MESELRRTIEHLDEWERPRLSRRRSAGGHLDPPTGLSTHGFPVEVEEERAHGTSGGPWGF